MAPLVAVACGGTGGHLFPGLAVAEELMLRGCDTVLLVSPKDVDQQIVKSAGGLEFATLPSIGMTRGQRLQFIVGFFKSYRAAQRLFALRRPAAVLAMGGFTSAPPIMAGRGMEALTYLHESNTIPGRANRWLAHVVTQAFVGFPEAAGRLHHPNVLRTGTPVRPQFQPADPGSCRIALGLDPARTTLLVMGGSQGASGVNDLVLQAVPSLRAAISDLQFLHLTGAADVDKVRKGYETYGARAVVRPFLSEMELAMGAATASVSRAGASSLAEIAALQLPSVLIPYPIAADNHQWHNAQAYVKTGAARMLEQKGASGEALAACLLPLLHDAAVRKSMVTALERWHVPEAAELIADQIAARLPGLPAGRSEALKSARSERPGPVQFRRHVEPEFHRGGQPA